MKNQKRLGGHAGLPIRVVHSYILNVRYTNKGTKGLALYNKDLILS